MPRFNPIRIRISRIAPLFAGLGLVSVLLTGCDSNSGRGTAVTPPAPPPPPLTEVGSFVSFVDGNDLKDWKVLEEIAANGGAEITDGVMRLGLGEPVSGVKYIGDVEIPVKDYELSLEAKRVNGTDFFCGVTFPVRSLETCATFVLGGWGGGLCGISCIDHQDAANNSTASVHRFVDDKWYSVRIEVREHALKVWLDDKIIVKESIVNRLISMRFGDIENCAPFGLANYMTTSDIRNLKITKLSPLDPSEIEKFDDF